MLDSDDELRKAFSNMTEVPFSEELRVHILKEATSRAIPSKPRRRWQWKTPTAIVGGLTAVACLLMLGLSPNELSQFANHNATTNGVAKNHRVSRGDGTTLLAKSGLTVHALHASYSTENHRIVVNATLINQGNDPISEKDVFGVLSFQTHLNPNPSLNANWVSFVNAPRGKLQPGDKVAWTFEPVGVDHPEQINHAIHPNLVFYTSRPVPAGSTPMEWKPANQIRLTHIQFQVRQQWTDGESVEVTAQLTNDSRRMVRLDSLLAILWYGDDWRTNGDLRFLNHVRGVNPSITKILPGQDIRVYFRLVGSKQPIMARQNPNIMLMLK